LERLQHGELLEVSRVTATRSAAIAELDLGGVDHAEFVRAKWMWTRRPKGLLGDGMSAYLLAVFIGLVLLLIPFAGIVLGPVWWVAMLFVVAKDAVRLARWRRDYESSIGRITRRCRKAK
jgi:hypothetical protein